MKLWTAFLLLKKHLCIQQAFLNIRAVKVKYLLPDTSLARLFLFTMNDDETCMHLESDRVALIIYELAGKLGMWDCSLLAICSGR